MNGFYQAAVLTLLGAILFLVLGKRSGELAVILCLAVCSLVGMIALQYWRQIAEFIQKLQDSFGFDREMVRILYKVTGIGILTEICVAICSDSGNTALGKSLQLVSCLVMVYLSIPMFQEMLQLIQEMLGNA